MSESPVPWSEAASSNGPHSSSFASLWINRELVHLEDLVLDDDTTPTHKLTIARDVMKTRRPISA
ncbi:hypothetical protein [Rhizobium phaseoli]|uniref:hypothetical protein n=1 Tax=Rhizobium phaseoli TaxID=396 RepID=UPI0019CF8ED3